MAVSSRTRPTVAFAAGRAADIPLLIGTNSGEDSLLNRGDGVARARATMLTGSTEKAAREVYGNDISDETLVRDIFRDSLAAAPARWIAGLPWRTQPAFLYYFDYVDQAQRPGLTRVPHGSEVFYVFGTFAHRPDGGRRLLLPTWQWGATVHGCWVSFVKTGQAFCSGVGRWPPYVRDGDASSMTFDDRGAHVEHNRAAAQLDWSESRVRWLIWLARIQADFKRWFGGWGD